METKKRIPVACPNCNADHVLDLEVQPISSSKSFYFVCPSCLESLILSSVNNLKNIKCEVFSTEDKVILESIRTLRVEILERKIKSL